MGEVSKTFLISSKSWQQLKLINDFVWCFSILVYFFLWGLGKGKPNETWRCKTSMSLLWVLFSAAFLKQLQDTSTPRHSWTMRGCQASSASLPCWSSSGGWYNAKRSKYRLRCHTKKDSTSSSMEWFYIREGWDHLDTTSREHAFVWTRSFKVESSHSVINNLHYKIEPGMQESVCQNLDLVQLRTYYCTEKATYSDSLHWSMCK